MTWTPQLWLLRELPENGGHVTNCFTHCGILVSVGYIGQGGVYWSVWGILVSLISKYRIFSHKLLANMSDRVNIRL